MLRSSERGPATNCSTPRLANGTLLGNLSYQGDRLTSDSLRLNFPGLSAQLALDGNLAAKRYRFVGPVAANGLAFEDIGTVNAGGRYRSGDRRCGRVGC